MRPQISLRLKHAKAVTGKPEHHPDTITEAIFQTIRYHDGLWEHVKVRAEISAIIREAAPEPEPIPHLAIILVVIVIFLAWIVFTLGAVF